MDHTTLLIDLFGRSREHVHEALDGLPPGHLTHAPRDGANPIGWLVWHLTRVQDHHVSELLGQPQLWETGEWAATFGLDPDPQNTGYGHDAQLVAAVRPQSAAACRDYYDAVADRTDAYIRTLAPSDLDRVVDDRWDPPVTVGVRLISVADDDIQHGGQACYVRGLLDRPT